jgi:hypothetical protein
MSCSNSNNREGIDQLCIYIILYYLLSSYIILCYTGPLGAGILGGKSPKMRRFVMKKQTFFRMIICTALAIGLILSGCDTGTNPGGGGNETENTGGNGNNTGRNDGNTGDNTGGNGTELDEVFNGTPASQGATQPLSADNLLERGGISGVSKLSDLIAAGGELYVNGTKVTSGSKVIQPNDTVRILMPKANGNGNNTGGNTGDTGGNTGGTGNTGGNTGGTGGNTSGSAVDPSNGTSIALTSGTWKGGVVASFDDVQWYKYSSSGTTYLWWHADRTNSYNGQISVIAYKSDGKTQIFNTSTEAWSSAQTITDTGTIYLKVEKFDGSWGATYGIVYSTNSSKPTLSSSKLSKPTNVTATHADYASRKNTSRNSIKITWSPVSGAVSYDVYEWVTALGGYWNFVAMNVTGTEYTHTGLDPATSHSYMVCAVGIGGYEGNDSTAGGTAMGRTAP